MNTAQLKLAQQWSHAADLSTLKGGKEWANRRWDTETLVFYNRTAFNDWLTDNGYPSPHPYRMPHFSETEEQYLCRHAYLKKQEEAGTLDVPV